MEGISMTESTSRRAILAGAVAMPAAALAVQNPDAELIDLGNKLAAAWPEHARLSRASFESSQSDWIAAREASGIPFCVRQGHPNLEHLNAADRRRAFAAWEALAKSRGGASEDALDAHYGYTDGLVRRMAELPAATLAGLAAKAMAAAHYNSDLWDAEPKALDWDKEHIRRLIDAVLSAAGIANPQIGNPQYVDLVDDVPIPPKEPDRVLDALDKHRAAQDAVKAADSGSIGAAAHREAAALRDACLAKPENKLTGGIQAHYIARALESDLGSLDNTDMGLAIVTLLRNVGEVMLPQDEINELAAKHCNDVAKAVQS